MPDPTLRNQNGYRYWDFGGGRFADYDSYKPLGYKEPDAGGDFRVEAQNDPGADEFQSRVKKRMDSPDEWSGQAIDRATSKIRDATEGRRKALRGMMAKRGVLGDTSVPELSEASLAAQEGRDVAAAATDISLGRERDKDAFLLGSQNAFLAPGQANRADRSLGLQTWQAAEGARLTREANDMQQWMGMLDATLRTLQML